jgi:Flp pilus assembly protein CpaB
VSSRKTLILIAAIGVGVFAGIALLNYVRGIERDVYEDAQPVEVYIATADIPEGTPAADALDNIAVSEVPLKIRPSTYIPPGNVDSIAGLVARGDIPRNQIIVQGLFVDPTVLTQSLRDQVPTGNVAISVEVDTIRAVGGYLQPGDEVNLMVNHSGACDEEAATEQQVDENGQPIDEDLGDAENSFGATISDEQYCTYTQPARYVYQRVEILAIGARQQLQTGEADNTALTPQGGTITFLVPNEAAQILASVAPEDIYLTLLPSDYEVEPLPALTSDLMANPTPAELSGCATPYGPEGFIEGDNETVDEENADAFTDFIRGHCALIWAEDGE